MIPNLEGLSEVASDESLFWIVAQISALSFPPPIFSLPPFNY